MLVLNVVPVPNFLQQVGAHIAGLLFIIQQNALKFAE